MPQLDFRSVAAAALASAHTLLPAWLGGKKNGNRWLGARKSEGGPGDSWSVDLNTGQWAHFGGAEKGADLVNLYAALNGTSQADALRAVADQIGMEPVRVNGHANGHAHTPIPATNSAAEPIPADAPHLPDHPKLGTPTAVYRYGNAFVVCRYEPLGQPKTFTQYTWRGGRWVNKGPGASPRPMYGRELLGDVARPILIVEGEQCAELAQAALPDYATVTWSGGASSVARTDWTPLAGRTVIIWPDNDQDGRKAASTLASILLPIAASVVALSPPDDAPPKWDIADAIAAGWDFERLTIFLGSGRPVSRDPVPIDDRPPLDDYADMPIPGHVDIILAGESEPENESSIVTWQSFGLDCNQGGLPYPTLANASKIIQVHPKLKNRVWWDSFRQKIYHELAGKKPLPWMDEDTGNLTVMIQETLKLNKFNSKLVYEAVNHAAHKRPRNSLTQWLDSLTWDGTPRLDDWLVDTLGVVKNPYTMAVARNWPIAMVARAYDPGCKMDNVLVLEGTSGLAKTSFLETLGGEFYKALPSTFGEKDFLQAIQGAWLIEIPDMAGFKGADSSRVLAIMTIRNDSYRASYGRVVEDHPRVSLFAATSETDDYLSDARGKRRYWPLRCREINIRALRNQRDQIFAEAIHEYRKGATWHEMPDEAALEQLSRVTDDLWQEKILAQADYLSTNGEKQITSAKLLELAIEMPSAKQTQIEKNRVAKIMTTAGWEQRRDRDARYWVRRLTKS